MSNCVKNVQNELKHRKIFIFSILYMILCIKIWVIWYIKTHKCCQIVSNKKIQMYTSWSNFMYKNS